MTVRVAFFPGISYIEIVAMGSKPCGKAAWKLLRTLAQGKPFLKQQAPLAMAETEAEKGTDGRVELEPNI